MNSDDMQWAQEAAQGWPATAYSTPERDSAEFQAARCQYFTELQAVQPGIAREIVFKNQDVRFYGGDNWGDVAEVLGAIPESDRLDLLLDLFGRGLLDFVLEAHFHAASFHPFNQIRLLRFGRCGLGPHISDPFLLLSRPEQEGLLGQGADEGAVERAVAAFVAQYPGAVEQALRASRIRVPVEAVWAQMAQLETVRSCDFFGVRPTGRLASLVWERLLLGLRG